MCAASIRQKRRADVSGDDELETGEHLTPEGVNEMLKLRIIYDGRLSVLENWMKRERQKIVDRYKCGPTGDKLPEQQQQRVPQAIKVHHVKPSQYDIPFGSDACAPVSVLSCISFLQFESGSPLERLDWSSVVRGGATLHRYWKNGARPDTSTYMTAMTVVGLRGHPSEDLLKGLLLWATVEQEIAGSLNNVWFASDSNQSPIVLEQQTVNVQYTNSTYHMSLEDCLSVFDRGGDPRAATFTVRCRTVSLLRESSGIMWMFDSHGTGNGSSIAVEFGNVQSLASYIRSRFPVKNLSADGLDSNNMYSVLIFARKKI